MDDSLNQGPPIGEIQRGTLEDFVIFCIKYEYFKRNSVQQAIRNLNEAVQKVEGLQLQEHLPFLADIEENRYNDDVDYGNESGENSDSSPEPERTASPEVVPQEPSSEDYQPVIKRAKVDKTGSTPEDPEIAGPSQSTPEDVQRRRIPSPDHDSDTSNISQEDDEVEETMFRGKDVTLHYRKCADTELISMASIVEPWSCSDFLTILSIRRITSTRSIEFPIDIIHATLGYRKLSIRIQQRSEGNIPESEENIPESEENIPESEENIPESEQPWFEIKYMSTKNGCFVWYGDTVRYDEKYKYQSLAAKDYFYMLKNNKMFEKLIFDIEEYTPRSVPVWPFESFFGKLRNYLRRFKKKLRTLDFSMMIFKPRGEADPVKAIATNTVLPFFAKGEEEFLISFEIDIWDDEQLFEDRNEEPVYVTGLVTELARRNNSNPVYHAWATAHRIKFKVSHYEWSADQFAAMKFHKWIEMTLYQEDFPKLIQGFSTVHELPDHSITFIVGEYFDLEAAQEWIDEQAEKPDGIFGPNNRLKSNKARVALIVDIKDESKRICFIPKSVVSSLYSSSNSSRQPVEEPPPGF